MIVRVSLHLKRAEFVVAMAACFLFVTNSARAQKANSAFHKGTWVVSAGHGIGNIWKSYLEDIVNLPGITYKVTSVGPYSFIGEYGISDRFSTGIQAGYSRITGRYAGFGDTFTDRLTIFSVLARINYHLLVREKWHVYGGGGLGYVSSKYDNTGSNSNRSKPGKFGYSGQLGARYMIKSRWGAFAEAGYVGGSFVQAGATISL